MIHLILLVKIRTNNNVRERVCLVQIHAIKKIPTLW